MPKAKKKLSIFYESNSFERRLQCIIFVFVYMLYLMCIDVIDTLYS